MSEQLSENFLGYGMPHGGGGVASFDPAKHPRGRTGRFTNVLGRLMREGGKVNLPHGVEVRGRLGGLEVRRRGRKVGRSGVAAVAAAAALYHFDEERVAASEVNPDLIHNERMAELEAARRQGGFGVTGQVEREHVEGLKRELMRGMSARRPSVLKPNVVGRSAASRSTEVPMYARNRPVGHPLRGRGHPRRDDVLAQIRSDYAQPHRGSGKAQAAESHPRLYGPGHERPGMDELERAGGRVVGGTGKRNPGVEPKKLEAELVARANEMSDTEFSVKANRLRRAGGWWPMGLSDWETPQGRALGARIRKGATGKGNPAPYMRLFDPSLLPPRGMRDWYHLDSEPGGTRAGVLAGIRGKANPAAGRKKAIYDVPVAGWDSDDDMGSFHDYYNAIGKARDQLNGEEVDITGMVKRLVPQPVRDKVARVTLSSDPSEGNSYDKFTRVTYNDGTPEGGDNYEQDHDLMRLPEDIAQVWYWSQQAEVSKKIDVGGIEVGDTVHHITNYDEATGKYGNFKASGTVVAKTAHAQTAWTELQVRTPGGNRVRVASNELFGLEPRSVTARRKVLRAEIALQRAHQGKLKAAGKVDDADRNEIDYVRPLQRELDKLKPTRKP